MAETRRVDEGVRVLIAEDEMIVAMDIESRLRGMGYTVLDTVTSGEKALRRTSELSPDLVLMDIALQGSMDGIEAARKIKDDADVPVVFVTANADLPTFNRAKQSEPFGYLTKPFEEHELRTTIEMALFKFQSEQRIRRSEERYRHLFNNMLAGVYRTTETGAILDCNIAFATMLGYESVKQIRRVNAVDFYFSREERETFLRELKASRVLHARESRLRKKDGSPIWIMEDVLWDQEGVLQGTAIDITRRKQAEHALNLSEERYHRLYDANPLMGFTVDAAGTIGAVNSAALVELGYAEEELLGKPVSVVFTPAEQGRMKELVSLTLSSGDVRQRCESELVRKDGTLLFAKITCRAARESDGTPIVMFVSENITSDRAVERALQESEAHYRAIVEGQSELICRLAPTLEILYANQAMVDAVRLPHQEILRRRFLDLFSTEGHQPVAEEIARIPWQEPVLTLELAMTNEEGETLWHEWAIRAFFDDAEKLIGYQCVGRDITERKTMEESLQSLERTERARTRELETIMDTVPAGIWIAHDRECREITGSRALYDLLEVPHGANISHALAGPTGLPFTFIRNGQGIPPEEFPLERAAKHGIELRGVEEDLLLADGTVKTIYGNVSPVRDENGEVQGAIGAFIDITGRKSSRQ